MVSQGEKVGAELITRNKDNSGWECADQTDGALKPLCCPIGVANWGAHSTCFIQQF